MNYLLHCWLARSDVGLKAGGFLGDFIKGPLEKVDCPHDLKQGLKLHRFIDQQSNQLPSLKATFVHFGPELRRPAPVLTDLMADHLFAKHWAEYGEGELIEFTRSCYESIGQYSVPSSAKHLYEHMCDTDLFARYADLQVIEDIMVRILKRLKFDHLQDHLAACLRAESSGFKSDFENYFYDLERCAEIWLAENACLSN